MASGMDIEPARWSRVPLPIKTVYVNSAVLLAYFSPSALVACQAAQRLRVASMIRFRPAALIFRFGLAGASVPCLSSAHRLRWPADMRRRAASLILRLGFPSP